MRIYKIWLVTLLLAVFMAGCEGGGVDGGGPPAPAFDTTPPTVGPTNPVDLTAGVPTNRKLTANFSEAIDPATCTAATFTLAAAAPVAGTVTCIGKIAIFTPTAPLAASTAHTATVTTGIKDLAGNALAANKIWTFTTGAAADATAPTAVLPTDPIDTNTGVPVNTNISATFSEPIDPATVTAATFTLASQASGPGCAFVFPDPDPCPPVTSIGGSASPTGSGNVVTFVPLITLTRSTTGASAKTQTYTATIKSGVNGVKDLAGVPLASDLVWSFTAGAGASAGPHAGAGPAPLALGRSAGFAVLAETGIANSGPSAITGDVGATTPESGITGFAPLTLTVDPDTGATYSTSAQVTGRILATNYHSPTPDDLATAVSDMGLAYTDAAGRKPVPAPNLNLGAGSVSGPLSLPPGLYKWTTAVTISGAIDLAGTVATGPQDAWIFQIAGDLNVANSAVITLSNGALGKNVFWQVGGQATLGTVSTFQGTILSNTQIVLQNGAKIGTPGTPAIPGGRALAKTQVTLDHSTVIKP